MRMRKDLGLYKLSGDGKRLKYKYTGAYYVLPFSTSRLLRVKPVILLGCLFHVFIIFLMGKLNFPSFRKLYVIIPFLGLVFIAGRLFYAAVSLFSWKDKMTARQHQISWHSLASGSCISIAAGALLLIGVITDVLFFGGDLSSEWPLLLLCPLQISLSACCCCFMKRRPGQIEGIPETPAASVRQDKISGQSAQDGRPVSFDNQ